MSFMEKRQYSSVSRQLVGPESQPGIDAMGGCEVEQLAFPDTADQPTGAVQVPMLEPNTRALVPLASPMATRKLDYTPIPETQTGALLITRSTTTTTSLREPVVIPGSGLKKSAPVGRPTTRRRMAMHGVVTALVGIVVLITLLAVVPVGGGRTAFSVLASSMNLSKSDSSNTGLVAQQVATATAVAQDGYDAGASTYNPYLPTAPASYASSGSSIHFAYGQCTYWADYRYHQLTGYYVPWAGSALVWGYNAPAYGWIVSTKPHYPSIIVLQPGVQYAGPYGHVAVVEQINNDGSVLTSNMNWTGQYGQVSNVTFWPGGSTRFVWHP